ncbi:MAG: hypothetical protein ACON5B_17755 [Myxococcota bacterium]
MSKQVTISSLVRQSAKTEAEFVRVLLEVFENETPERVAEYFDRLNVPRSVQGDEFNAELTSLDAAAKDVFTYEQERDINIGMQKYMDRHVKKLKWHAQRPSMEGARNVLLIMREGMMVTDLRLTRLTRLLQSKDELTPLEWSYAREMMNRAYFAFRNFLNQLGGPWIDAMLATQDREEFFEMIGSFYEHVDAVIRKLETHREAIEARREELTVLPPGHDPVKPPRYFGGDLLARGPWTQFWGVVETRSHHFREALN